MKEICCGCELINRFDNNNAYPFEGRCCGDCNMETVVPMRCSMINMTKEEVDAFVLMVNSPAQL